MIKQFTVVDSSVLINAAIGPDAARRLRALAIITDQTREFAATRFLKLEVRPIPTRYRRNKERWLYERFVNNVSRWVDEEPLLQPALDLACRYGLGAFGCLASGNGDEPEC
jgi:predicted nucleic acid-binding protein